MNKKLSSLKRGIAFLLCIIMLFSLNGISTLAEQTGYEGTETETETETEIETETETEASEIRLSYLVIGSSYLETPEEQYILAGIGDGTSNIESAVLHYRNVTTDEEYTVAADTIEGEAILFLMEFPDSSFTGCYGVSAIDYVADGESGTIYIEDTRIEAAFGVNQEIETSPDAQVVDIEDDLDTASIVMEDAEGNELTAADFTEALENASGNVGNDGSVSATGAGNLIVVLDPGHGGTDGGASGSSTVGMSESTLNLKIAAYCKKELETYSGVTVYMTRSTDSYMEISNRVAIAANYKADVLVSIHLNSSTNAAAKGAEVYYPNSSYNITVSNIGKELAAKIQEKLVALGLSDRGIKIRNSESGNKYGDGSIADYYGIIRMAKEAGFPAIIVEHAFISSKEDAADYLSTDAKLKQLGVADASGIAAYYGLKKKTTIPTLSYISGADSGSLTLSWAQCDSITGYQVYRAASETGTYSKIADVSGKKTTTYTDKSVKAGQTYYYKVRSVSSSSNSDFSPVMSAYPLKAASISSLTSDGSGKLKLKWGAVTGATNYQIYRSTKKSSGYTKVADVSAAQAGEYVDTTVKTATDYYYKIRAANVQNGKSCYSDYSGIKTGWSIAATKITGVNSQENGALLVKWNAVKNVYRYQVYRSTEQNGVYSLIATVSKTSYQDKTVKADTPYYYKVRTVNRVSSVNGYGSESAVKLGKQIAKTSITAIQTVSETQIKLVWSAPSEAVGYKVYRSTSKNGTYKLVKTISKGTTTSYTDSKLSTGKTYYYKVQALNKVGSFEGKGQLSSAAYTKLLKKTSIQYVQTQNETSLKVAWKKVSGAYGYQVARSTSKNGTYQVIGTTSSESKISYTDTTVTAGKTYYYKVSVITKNNGTSGYSAVVSGKTVTSTTISGVQGTSSTSLRISWAKSAGAGGYEIYRSTSKNGKYAKVAAVKSAGTVTYNDKSIKSNKTYYYKVRAYNVNNGKTGYSGYSEAAGGKGILVSKITGAYSQDTGALQLTWNEVTDAYRYQVSRSTSKNGSYKAIATVKTASYEDKSAKTNTAYYYKVRVVNRVGKTNYYGSYSSAVAGTQIGKTSISSIQAKSDTQLSISWKKVSGATGYRVYRSTSKNGTYTLIKSISKGSTTAYTDQALTPATTYYYKIQALNKVGGYQGCSELSKAASAKPLPKTTVQYVQTMGDTSLKVVWNKVDGAVGYQVARSTSKSGTYKVIQTVKSGSTVSYTDKTVSAGKTYYYKVSVTNKNNGTSGYSAAVSAKTAKSTTISKVQAVSPAAIELTWSKSSGADGYEVYRSTSEKGTYVKVGTVTSAGTLTYMDIPPQANTTYYYKVRAYNVNNGQIGYSGYSKAASGKSIAVPEITAVTLGANGALTVSWKKAAGAQSYIIYRKAVNESSYKKLGEVKSAILTYVDKNVTSGIGYSYKIQAFAAIGGTNGSSGYSVAKDYNISYTDIIGTTGVTAAQMVSYYNAGGKAYPTAFYQEKGAGTVADMAQIVLEEAAAEGVKAEVVWVQMCKETGYLQYGGQVKREQYNFCGLGAVDGGAAGADFSGYEEPIRMGFRAQVQHLKAYATDSDAALTNAKIDPRFSLVRRGTAKYVEWLGIYENPNTVFDSDGKIVTGCGWASDKNYGYNLVDRIYTLKSY